MDQGNVVGVLTSFRCDTAPPISSSPVYVSGYGTVHANELVGYRRSGLPPSRWAGLHVRSGATFRGETDAAIAF